MRTSWSAVTVRRTRRGATASPLGTRGGLRRFVAVTVGALLAVTAGGAAQADDLYNTIDGTTAARAIDADAERMPLTVGGSAGTTTLRVQARSSAIDGFEGCNLLGGPVSFAIRSSDPTIATVDPGTVEFTACTPHDGPVQERVLTVTPVSAGTATITATEMPSSVRGTFATQHATFQVVVEPPPNQPPTVRVTGVTPGATYVKGKDVPTPMCESTDPEDGTTAFEPAMSRPAPHGTDGLGERLARCTYTDSRGARAVASASYVIVDGSAPVVRYVLSKPRPANGWYRAEVALDWVVTEPESPGSLGKAGCDRVWITQDQLPTSYTCTATSSGGTTSVTSDPLQKDATPPAVVGTIDTPGVVVGGVTWYSSVPTITWSAEDPVSGVEDGTLRPTVTVAGEGRNQMARTVATDRAGNTGGSSLHYINVDASAPVVEATVAGTPDHVEGTRAWFKDSATVDVVASDPDVQPFERGSGLRADPTGSHPVTGSTTFTVTATDNVGHTGTSNAVRVWVDGTAPVVSAGCPAAPVVKGTRAEATWTASDEADGSGLAGASSGSIALDTTAVGRRTAEAPVATDNVGHTSTTATCSYDVVYAFTGFFGPVDMGTVVNKVKAGSAVPVKFGLGGDQGLDVLAGAPTVTRVGCPSSGAADVPAETAPTTTTSGLRYDAGDDRYTYAWKTAAKLAGTCQVLTVNLADGTSRTALFHFTR